MLPTKHLCIKLPTQYRILYIQRNTLAIAIKDLNYFEPRQSIDTVKATCTHPASHVLLTFCISYSLIVGDTVDLAWDQYARITLLFCAYQESRPRIYPACYLPYMYWCPSAVCCNDVLFMWVDTSYNHTSLHQRHDLRSTLQSRSSCIIQDPTAILQRVWMRNIYHSELGYCLARSTSFWYDRPTREATPPKTSKYVSTRL